METYDISSHCICGAINAYKLSFPLWPIVSVGARQDQYPTENQPSQTSVLCSDISLCPDTPHDKENGVKAKYLSRNMFYFAYDLNICDWVFGAGKPHPKYTKYYKNFCNSSEDDPHRHQRSQHIWYLSKETFKNLIENRKANIIDGQKQTCQALSLNFFTPLTNPEETIPLSKIALICLFPKDKKFVQYDICYKDKLSNERTDILLGRIPFAWYFTVLKGKGLKPNVLKDFQQTKTQFIEG